MTNLTITITEERLLQLKEKAERLGVTPDDLVSVSIEEMLTPPEDALKQAVDYVLTKNDRTRTGGWRRHDTCWEKGPLTGRRTGYIILVGWPLSRQNGNEWFSQWQPTKSKSRTLRLRS